ncbi:hypothetical protein J6590_018558 [Homalodisca vitripennis]|nr:hypothetical protein J6590_018558 [Homalodisca vitripennis]
MRLPSNAPRSREVSWCKNVHQYQEAKAQVDSGVLPPRYQPPPQPKALYPLQSTSSQDADCVVAVGDSGKQFQTVAEIDRLVNIVNISDYF